MSDDADNIVGLYERHAAAWDTARGSRLIEGPWLERFAALLSPGARLLDLGCGTGRPIAAWFMERGFRVTGVDSSAAMIERCRARFPDGDWRIADMRALALGESFAGIVAWDSFFHLTHDAQRAMFGVFAAHARPGAALMFTSGPDDGVSVGSFEGEPLYHASLAAETYRALLARHGFDVVAHRSEDPDCGGHTVWLARKG